MCCSRSYRSSASRRGGFVAVLGFYSRLERAQPIARYLSSSQVSHVGKDRSIGGGNDPSVLTLHSTASGLLTSQRGRRRCSSVSEIQCRRAPDPGKCSVPIVK